MKKIIVFVLASLMLLSVCGCNADEKSDTESIIGGADGPTAIIVTDGEETKMPAEIKCEETLINDDYCGFYKTLTAYAEDGSVMWTYKSEVSMAAQLETIEYLGIHNGLVYINEQALYDHTAPVEDLGEIKGRLRTLNAATGEVVWDNSSYDGGCSVFDFDEEGNIYIGGYLGPDCVKISKTGETIWSVYTIDSDVYWLYELNFENGEVTLSFEMNENGEEETIRLTANGEIIE